MSYSDKEAAHRAASDAESIAWVDEQNHELVRCRACNCASVG